MESYPVEVEQKQHGDHHSKHHHNHGYSKYFWMAICVFIIIVVVVLISVWIAYFWKVNVNTATISNLAHRQQQLIQSNNKDITQWNDLKNIYSRDSTANRLSLCYSNIYYTTKDGKNASLEEVTNYYQHVESEAKKSDFYYYSLKASLSIEFNVDLDLLIKNSDDVTRLKATKRHFMSIESDITSNYHHFSSIRLIEMGLDAKTRLLRQTHDPIILCSNSPFLREVPCYDENAPLLSVKYTKVTAMSRLSSSMSNHEEDESEDETQDLVYDKEKKDDVKVVQPKKKNDTMTYEMALQQHKHGSNVYKLKGLIEGLRIYSILFYKEDSTPSKTSTEERKLELLYDEIVALAVNPNKCN
jgi:hypothetical protein